MEDCLFCMIAEGKIPSKKLYEDEQVVAFYDINPGRIRKRVRPLRQR